MTDPTDALRAALDETLRPYLDQTGWSPQAIDQMLVGVTARLSGFHGVAAQPAEGLDVERLARALHKQSHHGRGGVDADLARMACVQFGWDQSRCVARAVDIARAYAEAADD